MKLKHAENIDDILNLKDQYRVLINSLNNKQQFVFCKFIPSAQLELYTNHLFFSTVISDVLIGIEQDSNIRLAIAYDEKYQLILKYDNFSYTVKEKSLLPSLIPYLSSEKYSKSILVIQQCLYNSISLLKNLLIIMGKMKRIC